MFKKEKILDAVLVYLKLNERENKLLDGILNDLQIAYTEEEKEYYEAKLITSNYVKPHPISHSRKILKLKPEGLVFITEGGFTKDKKIAYLKTVGEVLGFVKSLK